MSSWEGRGGFPAGFLRRANKIRYREFPNDPIYRATYKRDKMNRKGIYGGRSKYKRSKSKGHANSGSAVVSVLRNPFVNYKNPKIADGSVNASCGRQFRDTFVVTIGGDCDLFLFPSLAGGLSLRANGQSLYAPTLRSTAIGANSGLSYITTCHENQTTGNLLTTSGVLNADTDGIFTTDNNIYSWRVVSAGVRFKLLNNDNQNDGYFESVNVLRQMKEEYWVLGNGSAVTASTATNNLKLAPEPYNWNGAWNSQDSSYVAGRLKDIHGYQFILPRVDNESNFIINPANIGARFRTLTNVLQLGASSTSSETDLLKTQLDPAMGVTMIKLHPGTIAPSQLLVEYVMNIEVVYADSSTLFPFMTRSYHSSMDNKRAADELKNKRASKSARVTNSAII